MPLSEVLLSVGGIALTVLVAWLLFGKSAPPVLDESAARRIAEDALAGFEPLGAHIDKAGRAAIVEGEGAFALLKLTGDHWVVRKVAPPVPVVCAGDDLIVDSGEAMFGKVLLSIGADAARSLAARFGK